MINMVHDNTALTVSETEAIKVEDEAKRRLLASQKLSLVVDLDQTIIHATVDPTVAEWQKDEKNPNHGAVKDVRAFQLVDDGPGAKGCFYYIKLRPGLQDFLTNVSKMYELHIYTMGTRAYAQNIANIIDPDRKVFGDRILSRDESGSLVAKNLQRLFPVDTKMVVIIDDRGDVWNWNPNFIKVTPYDFFVGIGDINSSFLPKKPGTDLLPSAEASAQTDSSRHVAGNANTSSSDPKSSEQGVEQPPVLTPSSSTVIGSTGVSALEQLVSMGGSDDLMTRQAQVDRQDETLTAQRQERPLLQKQKQLEAEDAANDSSPTLEADDNSGRSSNAHENPDNSRHKLLQDHDPELAHLEKALQKVHTRYFETYTQYLASAQGGRVAQLRGNHKRKQTPTDNTDLALVPDIKVIMPQMKLRVLEGVVLVLSGVIPLHLDWHTSDITLWARNFGAKVEKDVGAGTTHVVAARNRTAKVRQAAKRGKGRIKVVSPAWLMDSISHWQKLDEQPYLLKLEESDAAMTKSTPGGDCHEILSESEDPPSGIDTEDDNAVKPNTTTEKGNLKARLPSLSLDVNNSNAGDADENNESDLEDVLPAQMEDEHSPIGGTNEDWDQMHNELAEFLGSENEESENESLASTDGVYNGVRGRKRDRDIESGDESSNSANGEVAVDGSNKGSPRKRQALARVSGLSHIDVATDPSRANNNNNNNNNTNNNNNNNNGLLTPDITAEEEGGNGDDDDEEAAEAEAEAEESRGAEIGGDADEDGDGWSEFEDDLEKEMERAAADDRDDDVWGLSNHDDGGHAGGYGADDIQENENG